MNWLNAVSILLIPFRNWNSLASNLNSFDSFKHRFAFDNATSYVLRLTADSFESEIFEQDYAVILEFHSSICDECARFTSVFNNFSIDIALWWSTVRCMAIDCFQPETSEICGVYNEGGSVPSLKYFHHDYAETDGTGKLVGVPVKPNEATTAQQLRKIYVNELRMEVNAPFYWPILKEIPRKGKNALIKELFEENRLKYIFLIYCNFKKKNTSTPFEVILDFSGLNSIKVLTINGKKRRIGIYDESATKIETLKPKINERWHIFNTIKNWLDQHNITLKIPEPPPLIPEEIIGCPTVEVPTDTLIIADLELAIYDSIFTEIPHAKLIKGESLKVLGKFLNLVYDYFPFPLDRGKVFIGELKAAVEHHAQNEGNISGARFSEEANHLKFTHDPILRTTNYVGCCSDIAKIRRYPCGLWQLFHFLTVKSAESPKADDPLEVLGIMHGFIENFFSCTACSKHFQQVAKADRLFDVGTKDEAILWLWRAHNTVNADLAGDATKDPAVPKLQFPSSSHCPDCQTAAGNFDEDQILIFMKSHYNNINEFLPESHQLLIETTAGTTVTESTAGSQTVAVTKAKANA